MRVPTTGKILCTLLLVGAAAALAEDWPTYMHDNRRSGVSSEKLDLAGMRLAWKVLSPAPQRTAWSGPAFRDVCHTENQLDALRNFDEAPFATIVGDLVFVGFSVNDSACAFDRKSGALRWRYTTGGPVRFPPAYADGRVFFGSDDGFVYCVDADSGRLEWKYTPIPPGDRRLVGNNGNLVPQWPVRTGVAIADGRAYFASSLTSWSKTYFCAIDAKTGKPLYRVDGGTSPMGAIMVYGPYAYLPQGRLSPVRFNRETGKNLGSFGGRYDCGAYALLDPDGDLIANYNHRRDIGLKKWDPKGKAVLANYTDANNVLVSDGVLYALTDTTLSAVSARDAAGLWSVECDTPHSLIKAGDALIAGGDGEVVAYSAKSGAPLWRQEVPGRVCGLAAGNGSLFVGTDRGDIFMFNSKKENGKK